MAAVTTENPYGLVAALEQGGIIAQVIFGIMVLGEPASAARIACIALIVSGILGLKLLSPQ